jgi:hypothetical protein
MHRWVCQVGLVAAFGTGLSGCGSDCSDNARFDGEWSVSARVVNENWQVSGFDTDSADPAVAARASVDQASLLNQIVVNGTRTWMLTRTGESDNYSLRVDGQALQARMVPKKGACNSLDLSIAGAWDGSDGSLHDFTLEGLITFLGAEITGEWKYTDSFSWEDRGTNGAVAIPEGIFTGTRDGADTGS